MAPSSRASTACPRSSASTGPPGGSVTGSASAYAAPTATSRSWGRAPRAGRLLDRDGLRQVPRLVDVEAAARGDGVGELLQWQHRQNGLELRLGARQVEHMLGQLADALVALRRDRDDVGAA